MIGADKTFNHGGTLWLSSANTVCMRGDVAGASYEIHEIQFAMVDQASTGDDRSACSHVSSRAPDYTWTNKKSGRIDVKAEKENFRKKAKRG